MCKHVMICVFMYNPDDIGVGFIKPVLHDGETDHLPLLFVGHSSGLLVNMYDLYKKQYLERTTVSFEKKLFAMFSLGMNFKRGHGFRKYWELFNYWQAAQYHGCPLSKAY